MNDLINKTRFAINNLDNVEERDQVEYNLALIKKEIEKENVYRTRLASEEKGIPDHTLEVLDQLDMEHLNADILKKTLEYLLGIQKLYNRIYKHVYESINDQKRNEDQEFVENLERKHHNETLEEFVTNKNEFQRIVEYKGELIQKKDPIYLDPQNTFLKSHFYAPQKAFFGRYFPTIWVNICVIWFSTILVYIALYFRLLKKFLDFLENLSFSRSK